VSDLDMTDQFTFKLTPVQAQSIFSALACFREELQYNKQEWKHTGWADKKSIARLRKAVNRFDRQLNVQYAETGIEVLGDEVRRTK